MYTEKIIGKKIVTSKFQTTLLYKNLQNTQSHAHREKLLVKSKTTPTYTHIHNDKNIKYQWRVKLR